ncbi:PREDICTED: uncharacterized protein LOC106811351 [Priapulus caudatus]|uniref:Uncharacterized protein LOC106811351 n=1 Tax=Priapulus caudatus TaxID=37621 RepID=A0ABM1EE03_PRICU|nr:PREDICTED: uncharacterized protein LOC106811351 [Priapulus caudatus]
MEEMDVCVRDSVDYEEVIQYLRGYYPGNVTRVLRKRAICFVLENDVLYYKKGHRPVILSVEERKNVLRKCHVDEASGYHLAREKMWYRVRNIGYWKGQYRDVVAVVHNCPECSSSSVADDDESGSCSSAPEDSEDVVRSEADGEAEAGNPDASEDRDRAAVERVADRVWKNVGVTR